MTTPENIAANAQYHTELLTSIAELDYVPTALEQQIAYVSDLESQLTRSEKRLQELSEKTKKERKEHATLRDSTTRRLAHKLTGRKEKFEAKESKEEREYVEALEKELTERDSQEALRQMLNEARTVLSDLKAKIKRHETLKKQLADLYSQVFDGPSETYPEDDRMEYELEEAHRRHDKIQRTLNQESQAAEILTKAVQSMGACQSRMQEALGYSRYDMWGGGGMSDMMERNALRTAQALAYQCEGLVDQACRISPQVQPVGRVNISQGSVISDVFFDNVFTDMAFHNKIKTSAAQVLLAYNRLKAERDACSRRADAAGAQLMHVSKDLEARRKELSDFRRATFESVAATMSPPLPGRPPTYEQVWQEPAMPASTAAPSAANVPIPKSPPPQVFSPQPTGSGGGTGPSGSPSNWKSRNPYAAAMAERTRSLSQEL